jgi:Ca-activated chloride channel family protein
MKRALIPGFVLAVLLGSDVLADGFIIPRPPYPGAPRIPDMSIKYHHVDITIDGQVARTTVDQVFINNHHRDIEGTYIFPIPPGASISDFSMYIGGEEVRGKILDRDEARRIYREIVRRRQDPALLEYFREGMFKASVYPIPARGETRVKLYYSEVLELDGGICGYRYTLGTEKFSRDPLENVRITVEIESKRPLMSIYSPSHDVTIEREDDHHALVTHTERNCRPNTDFLLYYTVGEDDIGFDMLAFEDDEGEGFFLAMVSPQVEVSEREISGKDIVFILDTSGSMKGEKIGQARGALSFCLNSLNERDRFNVIDFDDDISSLTTGMMRASRTNVAEALAFVRGCDAEGGTNINDALLAGLDHAGGSGEASYIIFLTDGLPTVGVTSIRKILANVRDANRSGTRVFVFGVGYDVNTRLLDRLAQDNGAASDYVRPGEDIEVAVSNFYTKISHPILTDVELSFKGIDVRETYPRELPDIFKGSQLLVFGKYDGRGRVRVTLTGSNAGSIRRRTYTVRVSPDRANSYIPRLWAARRIGYLIDQLRLHSEDRELVNEVVHLSKKYGIITEYTSFLVDADYRIAVPVLEIEAEKRMHEAMREEVGGAAVNRAKASQAIRGGSAVPRSFMDGEGRERPVTGVARAGARTFFDKNGLWVDSRYEGKTEALKVKRFSDAYFALLDAAPEVGRYLALGDEVIFLLNGTAVHVGDEGATEFTGAELRELTSR